MVLGLFYKQFSLKTKENLALGLFCFSIQTAKIDVFRIFVMDLEFEFYYRISC